MSKTSKTEIVEAAKRLVDALNWYYVDHPLEVATEEDLENPSYQEYSSAFDDLKEKVNKYFNSSTNEN